MPRVLRQYFEFNCFNRKYSGDYTWQEFVLNAERFFKYMYPFLPKQLLLGKAKKMWDDKLKATTQEKSPARAPAKSPATNNNKRKRSVSPFKELLPKKAKLQKPSLFDGCISPPGPQNDFVKLKPIPKSKGLFNSPMPPLGLQVPHFRRMPMIHSDSDATEDEDSDFFQIPAKKPRIEQNDSQVKGKQKIVYSSSKSNSPPNGGLSDKANEPQSHDDAQSDEELCADNVMMPPPKTPKRKLEIKPKVRRQQLTFGSPQSSEGDKSSDDRVEVDESGSQTSSNASKNSQEIVESTKEIEETPPDQYLNEDSESSQGSSKQSVENDMSSDLLQSSNEPNESSQQHFHTENDPFDSLSSSEIGSDRTRIASGSQGSNDSHVMPMSSTMKGGDMFYSPEILDISSIAQTNNDIENILGTPHSGSFKSLILEKPIESSLDSNNRSASIDANNNPTRLTTLIEKVNSSQSSNGGSQSFQNEASLEQEPLNWFTKTLVTKAPVQLNFDANRKRSLFPEVEEKLSNLDLDLELSSSSLSITGEEEDDDTE